MPICSTSCFTGVTLVQSPIRCAPTLRSECDSKVAFIKCNYLLPASGTATAWCAALSSALTTGNMIVTNKLKDLVWGEPETADVTFTCEPSSPQTVSRTLTYTDYNTYTTTAAGVATPYHDKDIYRPITCNKTSWNIAHSTCDGNIYIVHDYNCNPTAAYTYNYSSVVTVVADKDKETLAGKCLDIYKVSIKFNFDPKEDLTKPVITNVVATCTGANVNVANAFA